MSEVPLRQRFAHIRWMIRRDMPEVLAIETGSFEYPWLEEDFLCCLRQRNCIGMVVEQGTGEDCPVIAFMVFELCKTSLHIVNFAVHPEWRRRGVGRQMIDKLTGKLASHRRTRLTLEVRETNLVAQQFFRAQGFQAIRVIRNHYEDSGEDAYPMVYRMPKEGPIGTCVIHPTPYCEGEDVRQPSNYPPGVTGNEPQINPPEEQEYHCLSCGWVITVDDPSALPRDNERCSHEWEPASPSPENPVE